MNELLEEEETGLLSFSPDLKRLELDFETGRELDFDEISELRDPLRLRRILSETIGFLMDWPRK